MTIALETHGVSKRFGSTRALRSVDFTIGAGEVRALIGGNGSGKSTFIKILAGVETPDTGTIHIPSRGTTAPSLTSRAARHAGLRFVHQDLGLFDELDVAENFALGRGHDRTRAGLVASREVCARTLRTLARYEVPARHDSIVRHLSPLLRTKLAVARALEDLTPDQPGVAVFDEPTAAMSKQDAAEFIEWMRGLTRQGHAVIFVTHRLDEVLAASDSVTVFRDGLNVMTASRATVGEGTLLRAMVGKTPRPQPRHPRRRIEQHPPRLSVQGLTSGPIHDLRFDIGTGEIVGLAGLGGSGRSRILQALIGLRPISAGVITLDGQIYKPTSVRSAMDAGIGYVPENRQNDAIFPDLSVAANLLIADARPSIRHGLLHPRTERAESERLVRELGIRCGSPQHEVATLSGGNQQKAVIGRWLRRKPRLLLLDEPSQGVDVGARQQIENSIRGAAADGLAVLVATSDFGELASLCDRVLVLSGGRIAAELRGPALTESQITEQTYEAAGQQ